MTEFDYPSLRGHGMIAFDTCKYPGCERPRHVKGYCSVHYLRSIGDSKLPMDAPVRRMSKWGESFKWLRDHVGHKSEKCLIWPFGKSIRGRGGVNFRGYCQPAPRVMCILAHGEPPSDKHEAAHKCHNGHEGCVNPKHLYWATPSENRLDTQRSPKRKKQMENALFILEHPEMGSYDLADKLGMNERAVRNIRDGNRWGWLKNGL